MVARDDVAHVLGIEAHRHSGVKPTRSQNIVSCRRSAASALLAHGRLGCRAPRVAIALSGTLVPHGHPKLSTQPSVSPQHGSVNFSFWRKTSSY